MSDKASIKPAPFPRHFITMDGITADVAHQLCEQAKQWFELNKKAQKKSPILQGRTLINLFYEPSTRTRSSFELAGKRLGMEVINITASSSSVTKGESLIDTAQTLNAMNPDVVVLRHPQSGAAQLFAAYIDGSLINAGDGSHQHPTQALLDAFTLLMRKGDIQGLRIVICGDIAHSRVARSNITLLGRLGASVAVAAPAQMLPADISALGCQVFTRLNEAIKDADVIMLLRVQQERQTGRFIASAREYFHLFGLTHERLKLARPDALVMHPGPMNRGVEIDTALADDIKRHAILDQVEAGVAMRQALLCHLCEGNIQ